MTIDRSSIADEAMELIRGLLPTRRSLTGNGNREALATIRGLIPGLVIHEVPSGTPLFDWTTPPEWNVRVARLTAPDGRVVVDLEESPLHVVGYSTAVDRHLSLEELRPHLHSLPERTHAIPYRTSYYEPAWGFCLPHDRLLGLSDGMYHALIEADHDPNGSLSYGEATLGKEGPPVVLSSHICHPAQANDNLSGMAVLALAARYLGSAGLRRSVKALFLPGGIGSLAWLARNEIAVPEITGGLSLACLGDPTPLRAKSTRDGDTVVDRACRLAARDLGIELIHEPFDPYGFDERNFSSPGFDVPYGSVTRSPHGAYPEYHSSDDSLDLMDRESLAEAVDYIVRVVEILDGNRRLLRAEPRGEPQLGRRGLYGSIGGLRKRPAFESALLWVANFADGRHDLVDVAERSKIPFDDIAAAARALEQTDVVYEVGQADSQSTSG